MAGDYPPCEPPKKAMTATQLTVDGPSRGGKAHREPGDDGYVHRETWWQTCWSTGGLREDHPFLEFSFFGIWIPPTCAIELVNSRCCHGGSALGPKVLFQGAIPDCIANMVQFELELYRILCDLFFQWYVQCHTARLRVFSCFRQFFPPFQSVEFHPPSYFSHVLNLSKVFNSPLILDIF